MISSLDEVKTPGDLREYMRFNIEAEGFDYALRDYIDIEYMRTKGVDVDILDPQFAKLWREYIVAARRIEEHIK